MHFGNTILPMLLGAAAPSLCAPVDEKIDITVEIQIDYSNDGGFALESSSLHAPHPNSKSELNHGSPAASKPIRTTDIIDTIDGNFTLQVSGVMVGPSDTETYPGWFPLTLSEFYDPDLPKMNYTLVNGVLSQNGRQIKRFPVEDPSLSPKRLFVTERPGEATRWQVFVHDDGRTLGFLNNRGSEQVYVDSPSPGGFVMFPILESMANADLEIIGGGAAKGADANGFGAAEVHSFLAIPQTDSIKESHAARKSISTTDDSLATENDFTLWVNSHPVGPSTTRHNPWGKPLLSILDTKSEAANFSLDTDGHLKLGNASVQAFERYYNAGLAGEYLVISSDPDNALRWSTYNDDCKRTLVLQDLGPKVIAPYYDPDGPDGESDLHIPVHPGDPGVTLDIKYYSGVRGSNEGNLGAPKDQSPLMGQTELKK